MTTVILLHGGPGAPGTMAPLARELSGDFDVHEPWQRRSGEQLLTVAQHVEDLRELVVSLMPSSDEAVAPPSLVGHSWGAMLALAFGAAHPALCGPVVLVGCGTFGHSARTELHRRLTSRMDNALTVQLATLSAEVTDPDARLAAMGELLAPVYGHDLLDIDQELGPCDARGHHETWDDMLRLQREGRYPADFAAITSPVLMLHGAQDPHPGFLIRDGLQRVMPQLEHKEWDACGHSPWLERAVRDDFLHTLREWLAAH